MALLNSRYVQSKGGERQQQDKQETSKVGLAAIQDMAALQEAALTSEEVTPTNETSFLPAADHYQINRYASPTSPVSKV